MIKRTQPLYLIYFLLFPILFNSCESQKEVSAWDSVDSNSVLVLESQYAPHLPDKKFEPFFSKRTNLYLSSVQKSSKDDFAIAYSYLLTKESYDSLLSFKSWLKSNEKVTNRTFNGVEIHEVRGLKNVLFAFTYIKGIFVVSKSSLLIENAIRVFQNQEKKSFKVDKAELFQFPSLKSDQGNVYVNLINLSEISHAGASLLKSIPLLKELRSQSVYDLKSNKGFLSLNGFTVGKNSSLSLFQKQKPVTFEVAKYIPNNSNALIHFGISDFHSFNDVMDSSFLKTFDVGNEIAFISTDNSLSALVKFKPGASHDFKFITNYSETYLNYQIRSVDGEALKKGFGKIFPGILFGFCTVKDNYLFLSQSVDEMKSHIDAVESDETWGKTLDYQKFSERGLQESNVTLIFKNPDLSTGHSDILKSYLDLINPMGFSQVNWCSIQMSALDNHFYSTVNFSIGSSDLKSSTTSQNSKSRIIELPYTVKLASLVENHNTGLREILIQDSDLVIHLVSLKDGIIWKRKLESEIQGSIGQLDFYKNGKLQYFFISSNKIYVIDRLGRDVAGFPKSLPSSVRFSNLVDYDKNRNYRFLISMAGNEVYLFDKEGKNLSDWGPKKLDAEIVNSPEHIKVGGKDHFIVFLGNGSVQVYNRKGTRVKIFQTKDNELFSGDFYLESGVSSSTSFLYYVSKEGTVTKQNLDGVIVTTENLLRGKDSKFILNRIVNRDGFYFYRIDTDKVVVFDKAGRVVFEKQNSGSMNLELQSVVKGNGKVVFSFYDIEQRLVHVYDESGNSLIQVPIESDLAPLFGNGKSKSEFGIFSFPNNSIVFNPMQ